MRLAVVPLAWAIVLCAILLWPLTRSGYLLGHDLVFTPEQPLNLSSIGLSSASPRAVPLDALVALTEKVLDGAVVGRIALIVPVLAAGVGAAVLLGSRHVAAQLTACGFAVWNPYVVERLALGQWALLWSYAALAWLVVAIARRRSLALTAVAIAAASITPTGGVIAAFSAVVIAFAVGQRSRRLLMTVVVALVMQLPWLVPSLISTATLTSDPHAVAVFAARNEFGGGSLLALLGGGGIWDSDVVPNSRAGALPWLGLVVLGVLAVFGARQLVQLIGRPVVRALAGLALVGLVVAILASVPGGAALVRALVEQVPGAGLLRDAQKWLAPLVLLEALLAGAAVDRLAARVAAPNWRAVLVVVGIATPLLLLPDGASIVRATVEPVHYPRDWAVVVARADSATATVVPYTSYRVFAWAPDRGSVLDPAPRQLQIPTVVQDRLAVSGRLLTGEDARAAAVGRALGAGAGLAVRLRALGIRWVVVEHGTPGTVPDLSGLRRVHVGTEVSLYRVSGAVHAVSVAAWRVVLVVIVDLAVLAAALAAVALALAAAVRRRAQ